MHGIGERCLVGHRPAEQRHDLVYRLGWTIWITSRMPVADQEADVADDTVTDLAKAGQMDEETLLEQRGQRAVKVGGPCIIPETLDHIRRQMPPVQKKLREHSQPFDNQALQLRIVDQTSGFRAAPSIRIAIRGSLTR